jgi:lipopolysaccharide biosynthesis glycosyltransferase
VPMKYVYVLTSNDTDLFYEQFYLSVSSLRLHNPACEIVLLLDKKTKDGLTGRRSAYEKIISEIKVIHTPDELNQKEVSRWIKTSMRQFITGDFLYIDCDTIITNSLDYTFAEHIKIGAVPDCHVPFRKHHYYKIFRDENLKLGFNSIFQCDSYYNGGVIFCRDAPEVYTFFEKWHSLWKESRSRGNSQDMPSFNKSNYELHNTISEIGGEWNCQIGNNGLPFLYTSNIIHYFATSLVFITSPYTLASESVLYSIKKSGAISAEILEKLQNPKSAFEPYSRIVADKDVLKVFDSSIFIVLRRLEKKYKNLFKMLDSAVYYLLSFLKSMK